MRVKVLPYKPASKSAFKLATSLGVQRVRPRGRYVPRPTDLIFNWGCTPRDFSWDPFTPLFVNSPSYVGLAADKTYFFPYAKEFWDEETRELTLLAYTEDRNSVDLWLDDGHKVVARWVVNGHSGRGIKVVSSMTELQHLEEVLGQAVFFTKYVKKRDEYRVHVVNGEVIDVQQKRNPTVLSTPADYQIRSHDNGWIFCREDVEIPDNIKAECVDFVSTFGLDFGALDILHNQHYNGWWIVELNTAPGLEGQTLDNYSRAFSAIISQEREG
tara:strand:- start:14282 stop:15094 length:813 start_codon:yes stop_codon:yes gene_type:complete